MKNQRIPEKTMPRLLLHFSIRLLILALSLGLIQSLVYKYVVTDIVLFIPIWKIYSILVFLSLATYGLVILIHYIIKEYTGFAFIASILLKMFVVLWFLFPLIESELANKIPDVINFFLPFFIFLAMEVWFSIRLLQSEESI